MSYGPGRRDANTDFLDALEQALSLDESIRVVGSYSARAKDDPASGSVASGAYTIGDTPAGPGGDGVLAILTLHAVSKGESDLGISSAQITDHSGSAQSLGSLVGGHVSGVARQQTNPPLASE
jgi:hypothetical protein